MQFQFILHLRVSLYTIPVLHNILVLILCTDYWYWSQWSKKIDISNSNIKLCIEIVNAFFE
jgi:hypothetical protein